MSFQIYPTLQGETFPVTRRAIWSTITQTAASGLEVRIGQYIYPVWEWDIPYSWLSQDAAYLDYQKLQGFINSSFGSFAAFLYNDLNDNTTSPDAPTTYTPSQIALGDGVKVAYQIGRTMNGFFEPLFDINNTIPPKIYVNAVLKTSGSDYNISATGLITFTAAPGLGLPITADFQYYWRVRFKDDSTDFENFVHSWWEAQKVTLRQVKAV